MARNQPRRSARKNQIKTPEPSRDKLKTNPQSPQHEHEHEHEPEPETHRSELPDEERCPACTNERSDEWNAMDKENWIRCDACKTWFHWRCMGNGDNLEVIDKWFCKACIDTDSMRVITVKPPARKSSRKRIQPDYAHLNSGLHSDPHRWTRLLEGKRITEENFQRMKGSEVATEWLLSHDAMREPIIIEDPSGLGMKMPSNDLTIDDIALVIGEDTPIEVIDVASQSASPGWTLGKWAEYFNLEPSARDRICNVISLEVSGTKLADEILPPRLVRELDWVEKFWPNTRRGKGHVYPKVQLYCLMGVAGAWTDWHIDFAGSSVYYHIVRGSKVFYFIRPTASNLAAYERWSGTELQNHSWLGDMVDDVYKVELQRGNTMIIPTGWIHAVYTPVDTLVFGGNFLHSYNVSTQLKVRNIELATQVPKKFRFPLFTKLCWYVGEKYLRDIKNKEEYPPRVLESIEALSCFLVQEARIMERGSEQAKREAKEQVPSDRVKDPPAIARELRWRVRMAAGYLSDDEDISPYTDKAMGNGHIVDGVGQKRKRGETETTIADTKPRNFKNFQPKFWESIEERREKREKKALKTKKSPDDNDWNDGWLNWDGGLHDGEDGEVAVVVDRRLDVITKVRKTASGIERQKIERVSEEWVWSREDGQAVP